MISKNNNLIGAVMAATIGVLFYNVMPIYLGYLMEAKNLNCLLYTSDAADE